MRVYRVDTQTNSYLVEAHSQAQAINHIVRGTFTAKVVSSSELLRLIKAGVQVSTAGEQPNQDEEPVENTDQSVAA